MQIRIKIGAEIINSIDDTVSISGVILHFVLLLADDWCRDGRDFLPLRFFSLFLGGVEWIPPPPLSFYRLFGTHCIYIYVLVYSQ